MADQTLQPVRGRSITARSAMFVALTLGCSACSVGPSFEDFLEDRLITRWRSAYLARLMNQPIEHWWTKRQLAL